MFGSLWLAILVLVAAVLASYANSLRCPFVFDDHYDIIDNPAIRHLWPLWDVFLVRSTSSVGLQSRPVVNLSFALDYAVGGLNTLPYHVTNLAIHVLAGLALFGVVRRTLLLPRLRDRFGQASVPLALAVALLWAVHPLQTESVTYITQRYESMMGLFYLVAVYGVIRCGDSTHAYRWGAVTVAATLLSLGSKEVAVSLPIMILLYDRVLLSGSFSEIWRRRWGLYLALLAAWAAFAVLQLRVGPRPLAGYALPLSWFDYARSQPGVILHYLRLAFWPQPLVLDYGWPPARTVGDILPGAIVVAGLLAATGYAFWRWPAWGLLGAWFFLILAPTSSVMPLADLAFEHRMYLPLAAVGLRAWCWASMPPSQALVLFRGKGQRVSRVACWAVLPSVALAVLTCQRNIDYRDEVLIWQDIVVPASESIHAPTTTSASPLAGRGQVDEAIAHYRKALEIKPDYAEAHNNLGLALAGRGQVDEAIAHYRKALEIKPDYRRGPLQPRHRLGRPRTGRRGHRPLPQGPGNQARLCRGPQQPRHRLGRPRADRRGHRPLSQGPGNQARLRQGPQQSRPAPWPAAGSSKRPSPITGRPWKSSPTTPRPTATSAMPGRPRTRWTRPSPITGRFWKSSRTTARPTSIWATSWPATEDARKRSSISRRPSAWPPPGTTGPGRYPSGGIKLQQSGRPAGNAGNPWLLPKIKIECR